MALPSWMVLERDEAGYGLPEHLRSLDPAGGVDCGWVGQMRPFLRWFSRPGERVLDPFAGFGSTLVACELEGRRGVGVEIEVGRSRIARERLGGSRAQVVICGDARWLPLAPASVDLCLTSVPYFGFRRDWSQSAGGQVYAAAGYDRYLELLRGVFASVRRVLKHGARVVVMAENVRLDDGTFVPLAWDVGRLLAEHFRLEEERILCYRRPVPNDPSPGRTNRAHEYALVAHHSPPGAGPSASRP